MACGAQHIISQFSLPGFLHRCSPRNLSPFPSIPPHPWLLDPRERIRVGQAGSLCCHVHNQKQYIRRALFISFKQEQILKKGVWMASFTGWWNLLVISETAFIFLRFNTFPLVSMEHFLRVAFLDSVPVSQPPRRGKKRPLPANPLSNPPSSLVSHFEVRSLLGI